MELFFMMTAMLTLIVPIAVGRVRCVLITPRLRNLFRCMRPIMSVGDGLLSGKPACRPAPAWPTRPAAILSEGSSNLSNFVRLTADLARVDNMASANACRPQLRRRLDLNSMGFLHVSLA